MHYHEVSKAVLGRPRYSRAGCRDLSLLSALTRMREALALRPTDAPGRPEGSEVAPNSTTRREPIAALVLRVEKGDLAAVATLRELLADK
jgi:hypothetical protein